MNFRSQYVTDPYGAEVHCLRGFLFILDKYGSEECHTSINQVLYSLLTHLNRENCFTEKQHWCGYVLFHR